MDQFGRVGVSLFTFDAGRDANVNWLIRSYYGRLALW
jgi:hypothetical protein